MPLSAVLILLELPRLNLYNRKYRLMAKYAFPSSLLEDYDNALCEGGDYEVVEEILSLYEIEMDYIFDIENEVRINNNKKYLGTNKVNIPYEASEILNDHFELVMQAVENKEDINLNGTMLKLYKRHKHEYGYYDNNELFMTININPKIRAISCNLWEDVIDGGIRPDYKCVMRFTESEFEKYSKLI